MSNSLGEDSFASRELDKLLLQLQIIDINSAENFNQLVLIFTNIQIILNEVKSTDKKLFNIIMNRIRDMYTEFEFIETAEGVDNSVD